MERISTDGTGTNTATITLSNTRGSQFGKESQHFRYKHFFWGDSQLFKTNLLSSAERFQILNSDPVSHIKPQYLECFSLASVWSGRPWRIYGEFGGSLCKHNFQMSTLPAFPMKGWRLHTLSACCARPTLCRSTASLAVINRVCTKSSWSKEAIPSPPKSSCIASGETTSEIWTNWWLQWYPRFSPILSTP